MPCNVKGHSVIQCHQLIICKYVWGTPVCNLIYRTHAILSKLLTQTLNITSGHSTKSGHS